MPIEVEGQLQLGSHPIGTGHQHRLLVALGHLEQGAETADPTQHAIAQGFLRQRLDPVHQRIAGIDINTRVAVGKRAFLVHGTMQEGGKGAILPETTRPQENRRKHADGEASCYNAQPCCGRGFLFPEHRHHAKR